MKYRPPEKCMKMSYVFEGEVGVGGGGLGGFDPRVRGFLNWKGRHKGDRWVEPKKVEVKRDDLKKDKGKGKEEDLNNLPWEERQARLEEKKKTLKEKEEAEKKRKEWEKMMKKRAEKKKSLVGEMGEDWHTVAIRQLMLRIVIGLGDGWWEEMGKKGVDGLFEKREEGAFWCLLMGWFGDWQMIERRRLLANQGFYFFCFYLFI